MYRPTTKALNQLKGPGESSELTYKNAENLIILALNSVLLDLAELRSQGNLQTGENNKATLGLKKGVGNLNVFPMDNSATNVYIASEEQDLLRFESNFFGGFMTQALPASVFNANRNKGLSAEEIITNFAKPLSDWLRIPKYRAETFAFATKVYESLTALHKSLHRDLNKKTLVNAQVI